MQKTPTDKATGSRDEKVSGYEQIMSARTSSAPGMPWKAHYGDRKKEVRGRGRKRT